MRTNERRWLRLVLGLMALATAMVSAACGDPPKPPSIYQPSGFVWATETYVSDLKATIPTTAQSSGPTVKITAIYIRGYGPPLQGSDLKGQAATKGQQVLADLVDQMKHKGWQVLYNPATKGSFPQYVLYVTFRQDSHYCYFEYDASNLDPSIGAETLDVYHN